MTSIVSYQKVSTPYTTIDMILPEGATELATLAGLTYVAVPDGAVMPDQPQEITITPVALTPELRAEIKAASPHCAVIQQQMEAKIRARYSRDDEQFYARIAGGKALGMYEFLPGEQDELLEYQGFVEGVREWGRLRRADIGLG